MWMAGSGPYGAPAKGFPMSVQSEIIQVLKSNGFTITETIQEAVDELLDVVLEENDEIEILDEAEEAADR